MAKQSTSGATPGAEVPGLGAGALAFSARRGGRPWQGPAVESLIMPWVCHCEIPLSPWLVPAGFLNKWAQMGGRMTGLRPRAQLAVPHRGIALTGGTQPELTRRVRLSVPVSVCASKAPASGPGGSSLSIISLFLEKLVLSLLPWQSQINRTQTRRWLLLRIYHLRYKMFVHSAERYQKKTLPDTFPLLACKNAPWYIYTYIDIYLDIYIHTSLSLYMYTYVCTNTHTCTHTLIFQPRTITGAMRFSLRKVKNPAGSVIEHKWHAQGGGKFLWNFTELSRGMSVRDVCKQWTTKSEARH